MVNTSTAQYMESEIATSSPNETVLKLYDGSINFLKSALIKMDEEDGMPGKAKLVEKTVNIVDYLQSCLDKEKGGVIAKNLDALYDYMMVSLTEANIKNDKPKIKEIMGLLQELREGWSGIMKKPTTNNESTVENQLNVSNYGGEGQQALTSKRIEINI